MKILNNSVIDQSRWDRCINKSLNGNIYGLSWYLNITCPDWEGVIKGDYQAVMPVPVMPGWRKKLLSQPPFTWQLGIYSNSIMDRQMVDAFISQIPASYRIRKLDLNKLNSPGSHSFRYRDLEHTELDLIPSYDQIRQHYDKLLIDSMNESGSRRLTVTKGLTANEFLQFIYHHDRSNKRHLKPKELHYLRLITSNSIRYRFGELFGAYSPENNLCGAALIIKYRQKASVIYTAADKEGMSKMAITSIIEEFIKTHAEQKLILGVDDPDDKISLDLLRQFGGKTCRFTRITGRA